LERIQKFATTSQNLGATIVRTTGHYLRRAVIIIQAHPIPAFIAAIVVVAVAIFTYNYYIQPTKSDLANIQTSLAKKSFSNNEEANLLDMPKKLRNLFILQLPTKTLKDVLDCIKAMQTLLHFREDGQDGPLFIGINPKLFAEWYKKTLMLILT
jgi:hypothetical protein